MQCRSFQTTSGRRILRFRAFKHISDKGNRTTRVHTSTRYLRRNRSNLHIIKGYKVLPSTVPTRAVSRVLLNRYLTRSFLLHISSNRGHTVNQQLPHVRRFTSTHHRALHFLPVTTVCNFRSPPSFTPFETRLRVVNPLQQYHGRAVNVISSLQHKAMIIIRVSIDNRQARFQVRIRRAMTTYTYRQMSNLHKVSCRTSITI